MGSVGLTLREAREGRGLSVAEVAESTHIPRFFVEAIEEDRFDLIPAPVYVRGFLRIYAGSVGVDPTTLIRRLDPRWQPGFTGSQSVAAAAANPAPDGILQLPGSAEGPTTLREGGRIVHVIVDDAANQDADGGDESAGERGRAPAGRIWRRLSRKPA